MRHTLLPALAAVLLLAGCVLETPERARCDDIGGTGHCPVGQRCGADGTCSVAATACEQIECGATTCEGNTLRKCVISDACSAIQTEDCDADAQACDVASQSCQCVDPKGCTGAGTMCTADRTAEIACAAAKGCPYRLTDAPSPCAIGKTCQGDGLAGGCACPPEAVAVQAGCAQEDATTCALAGQVALRCQRYAVGSDCLVWREERNCGADGLVCGAGACQCPSLAASGRRLVADSGSATDPGIVPNGADPAFCRYKTLAAAILDARDGDTVKAMPTPTQPFREPGFTIKTGVNVVGDESSPVVPANVVIELDGAGTQGVVLASGASLSGVTVRRADGAAAAVGIEVQGPSPDARTSLNDVWVTNPVAGNALTTGVLVSGSGDVRLQGLTLLDVAGSGLEISRGLVTDTVSVTTLLSKRNTIGVNVKLGDATLTGATVVANTAQGVVVANGSVNRVGLGMADSSIRYNGGGGLSANRLTRLHLERVTVCGNSAPLQSVPGFAVQRRLGGVTLGGSAPADQLVESNVFHDNSGDQVAFIGSGAVPWNFSAAACGAKSNVFAGYVSTQTAGVPDGTGILATGVNVTATRAGWPQAPAGDRDFLEATGGLVNADGGAFEYCTLQQVTPFAACDPVPATP